MQRPYRGTPTLETLVHGSSTSDNADKQRPILESGPAGPAEGWLSAAHRGGAGSKWDALQRRFSADVNAAKDPWDRAR